jgi:uncharacterized protein
MNARQPEERPVCFSCADADLVGVLHLPSTPSDCGVLVVVGGPQYRAGSHRQFLLLARALAAQGYPALRFDHRGIGDSEGSFLGFQAIDEDIAAAIDAFFAEVPEMKRVVLWGLCDAASAILFYAHRDPRVDGIVLLNPWVRTEQSEARAYLRHYYLRRLTERDFWLGVLTGRFKPGKSFASLGAFLRRSRGAPAPPPNPSQKSSGTLPEQMAAGFAAFPGRVLLILSGRDLTAKEFVDCSNNSVGWQALLRSDRVRRHELEEADHTFSRGEWRDKIAAWTVDWLRSA